MKEIEVGIDGSGGVRCGVIGEIGCSYPLMDVEKKALLAAASAQTKTGETKSTTAREKYIDHFHQHAHRILKY